jgi:hypothetical protein
MKKLSLNSYPPQTRGLSMRVNYTDWATPIVIPSENQTDNFLNTIDSVIILRFKIKSV